MNSTARCCLWVRVITWPVAMFQRGEQVNDTVADIVVGATLDLPGSHRQRRFRAVESLNAGFLVDAQHHGLFRRVHIQTNDVTDFVDELRVFGVRGRPRRRATLVRNRRTIRTGPMAHPARTVPDAARREPGSRPARQPRAAHPAATSRTATPSTSPTMPTPRNPQWMSETRIRCETPDNSQTCTADGVHRDLGSN